MPDYRLDHLSTRSFEQLVQALALKHIGPAVTIFGDGPDGGREATFSGRVRFPTIERPWDGTGVLQAKFRQVPADPGGNASWLLSELRKEMAAYQVPSSQQTTIENQRKRTPPHYFILTTNVSLSAVRDTGGIDRVRQQLRVYAETFRWRDFDLWDAAKIHRLLDDSADIRTAYAAWITPGDVLTELWKELRELRPNFGKAMTLFLQKELVAAQYAKLRQAGHSDDRRVPLSRVFIDLPVGPEQRFEARGSFADSDLSFIDELLRRGNDRLAMLGQHRERIGSARHRDLFETSGRIVLLGGPGQGKTTLGQYACQLYRAALLKASDTPLSKQARDALQLFCEESAPALAKLRARRYPIHIDLKHLASHLERRENLGVSLLRYLSELISQRADIEIGVQDLRIWLTQYPWLVILDGLDEVPTSSNRAELTQCISEFIMEAETADADILILVTCRPQGYSHEFERRYYDHLWLLPLSEKKALEYGQRLIEARHVEGTPEYEIVRQRLLTAAATPATARLLHTPLQVTIMIALVERLGTPPEQRWALFSEYYRVIYDRETERDTQWSGALRQYKPDVDAIHRRIAFLLHRESEHDPRQEAMLSVDAFRAIVEQRLLRQGHEGTELSRLLEVLCEAVRDRLVFLAGIAANKVGFEIRSLQEFMAADYLLDAPDASSITHAETVKRNLTRAIAASYWRNVVLFAAARVYSREQHYRDFIEAQCQHLNESVEDGAHSAALTGSKVALEILEDGSARSQPNSVRVLTRIACRLLRRPPDEHVERLALQHNALTDTVLRDEITRGIRSSSYSESMSAWKAAAHLAVRGINWSDELMHAHMHAPERLFATLESSLPIAPPSRLYHHVRANLHSLSAKDFLAYQDRLSDIPHEAHQMLEDIANQRADDLAQPRRADARGRLETRLKFRGKTRDDVRFKLQGIHLPDDKHFKVETLPQERASWHVDLRVGYANRYFTLHPSLERAATALSWLGEDVLDSTKRSLQLIWPLEACVRHCQDGNELRDMTRKIRDGLAGSIHEWEVAEKRWARDGVSREDLIRPRCPMPVDPLISFRGFPIEASQPLVNRFIEPSTMRELQACYQLAELPIQTFLGDLLGVLQHHITDQSAKEENREVFTELAAIRPIDPAVAMAAVLGTVNEKFIRMLSQAKYIEGAIAVEVDTRTHRTDVASFVGQTLQMIRESRQPRNLLRVLSYFDPCWPQFGALPRDTFADMLKDDYCPALVLQIDQFQWNESEARALAARIVDCSRERPDLVSRTCHVIRKDPEFRPEGEALLIALLDMLPDTDQFASRRHELVCAIDDLIKRRSARFPDC